MRDNANTQILGGLKTAMLEIPYEVTGLDFDNGTEFLNKAVIKWAAEMEIFFTHSRPYEKNDQALSTHRLFIECKPESAGIDGNDQVYVRRESRFIST